MKLYGVIRFVVHVVCVRTLEAVVGTILGWYFAVLIQEVF